MIASRSEMTYEWWTPADWSDALNFYNNQIIQI